MQILHSLAFVINDQSLQHVSMCILLLRFLASARICVPIRKCILRRSSDLLLQLGKQCSYNLDFGLAHARDS
jgi:hypothetical protein